MSTQTSDPSRAPAPPEAAPTDPAPNPWTQQWYAVAVRADLRTRDLHAVRLFDRPLVLFVDAATGLPTALDDVCPHRAVKLSDGRLVDVGGATRVECAYHGWQFGATGECTHRPAAPPGEKTPASCNVRRYAVETNAAGIVFVFLGDLGAANDTSVPGPEIHGPGVFALHPFSRRLPVGLGVQVENLVDPAHFPFAHHGTSSGDRDAFSYNRVMEVKSVDDASGTMVFAQTSADGKFLLDGVLSRGGTMLVSRNVPEVEPDVQTAKKKKKGVDVEFIFYLTPVSRHETLLFLSGSIAGLPAPAVFLARLQPRWMSHCASHVILDGDTHLLQHGEAELARRGATWRSYVNRNGVQDAAAVRWRQWLEPREKEMPFVSDAHAAPPEMALAVVNDRFRWHGAHCVACQGALRNLRAARVFALIFAVAAAAFAAGAAGASAWGLAARAVAVMLVAAVVVAGCQRGVEALTVTKKARKLYEA